jgi:hypothetical protein
MAAAIEPPKTFTETCAEIDAEIQASVYASGKDIQAPHTWDADCDVECVQQHPWFTVGYRYRLVEVNKEAGLIRLYSDDKSLTLFGFNDAALIFKLHSRPAK